MANVRLSTRPNTPEALQSDSLMWVERDAGGGVYASEKVVVGSVTTPTYTVRTTGYTAAHGDYIEPDNSSGDCTINLPISPLQGTKVFFQQKYNQPFLINNLIVGRNGETIGGLAEDMLVDTNHLSFYIFFNGVTWVPVKERIVGNTL